MEIASSSLLLAMTFRYVNRFVPLALPAWNAIGDDGCARLRELVRPFSRVIVDQGGLR